MKFFYLFLFTAICVLSADTLIAQPLCGFDQAHTQLLNNQPGYASVIQQMNTRWVQKMSHNGITAINNTGGKTVYEIPVVIHVINTGGAVGTIYNPTDSQLLGMLNYLNQTYAATYSSYPDTTLGGTYIPLRFVLAKRDPNCNATTGITRTDGSSVTNYTSGGVNNGSGTGASETAVKALNIWPNTDYYNIWVVNKINGQDGTSGTFTAGYAYFPGAPASLDGTIMLATQAQAGSITLPHEMAHAFGVYHTFQGNDPNSTGANTCPVNNNCLTDGDMICDTEPETQSVFNCPTGINPCTGLSYNNVTHNFMDYSSCQNRFTAGQRDRIINGLLTSRPGLLSSLGGVAPGIAVTAASCTITTTNTGNQYGMGPVQVVLNNIIANSLTYTSDLTSNVDKTCIQQAIITQGQSYTLSVNTIGNPQKVKVYIDYNNDGVFTEASELVYSHSGTTSTETHSTNFTVPTTGITTCIPLRMRVIADYNTIPANGCGAVAYGQAEDYAVYVKPAGAITLTNAITSGANPSCPGSSITFTATPSTTLSNPVYQWYINGVATGGNSTTLTAASIANNSPVVCRVFTGTCGTDSVLSNTITIQDNTTWTGTVSTDWNTAGNWSCGVVPGTTAAVVIPSGTPYAPAITTGGPFTVASLNNSLGDTLTLNSSVLNVTGPVTNNGTIAGTGKIVLSGISIQQVYGTGLVNNIEVNNIKGAVIPAGNALNIGGTLTLTAGLVTTNDLLTLKSNTNGTGRLDVVASGEIAGNIRQERYIPGGRRAFRFFSHPFTTAIALSQLTGQIDITGTGGSSNGFTTTITNNPSAFYYSPASGNGSTTNDSTGWIAFTSATASSWAAYQGVRILIRGAKNEGLLTSAYTPSATTISMLGVPNTGTKTISLIKGTNSGYNVIGNPYPSPVNVSTVLSAASNISGSGFWVWDANAATRGAYVPLPISMNYNLPSNSAFVVNVTAATTLTFQESNKASAATANLYKATAADNLVRLDITSNDDSVNWDRLYLSFNDAAANTFDNTDATKLDNPDLNFYTFSADDTKLSIDSRPFVSGAVIPIGLKTNANQVYTLKVASYNLDNNKYLYLHDKYLQTMQQIQSGRTYAFIVTSDTLSQGDSRFEINAVNEPLDLNAMVATRLTASVVPNPAKDKVSITFTAMEKGMSSIKITNILGQEVYSRQLGFVQSGNVNIPLQNMPAGMYMVSIRCGNEVISRHLSKQ